MAVGLSFTTLPPFLLMTFPSFSFKLFSSAYFPLQPASFLFFCSNFLIFLSHLVSLCLSLCPSSFLSLTASSFDSCYSVLQTDGWSQGHGEVSGWGDGLQDGGLYCERHPVRLSLLSLSSLFFFSGCALFLNMCSVCQTHTQS